MVKLHFIGKCSKYHLFFIFHEFHAFRPRFLNFFGNCGVFVFVIKLWVWELLFCYHMAMYCILLYISFHAISRLCAWVTGECGSLDWIFAHDAFNFACHMLMHSHALLFLSILISKCVLFPFSLVFLTMAPKKSIPSKINLPLIQ